MTTALALYVLGMAFILAIILSMFEAGARADEDERMIARDWFGDMEEYQRDREARHD